MRKQWIAIALLAGACQRQPGQMAYDGGDYNTDAAKIEHGKRLANVLHCTGCHGPRLQGENMADKPEDGAIYSPNITLLIPLYTNLELDKLIRHGIPKDGRKFWFMPVESFQFLGDRDFVALVAYLRTIEPAGRPLPAFKFNAVEYKDVEQGILGDSRAQIRKYREKPPIDLGPEHAWGRYLVETTCTACHNNALQGWPNFTPDLDIAGAYSKTELTQFLTNGKGKAGKDVGPMSGIVRADFSHLTARERGAIVGYLLARANRPQ
jgi:mono/diheme cytochrome c family protein